MNDHELVLQLLGANMNEAAKRVSALLAEREESRPLLKALEYELNYLRRQLREGYSAETTAHSGALAGGLQGWEDAVNMHQPPIKPPRPSADSRTVAQPPNAELDRLSTENALLREAFTETQVIFEDSRIEFVDVRVPRSLWLRLRAWRAADREHGRPGERWGFSYDVPVARKRAVKALDRFYPEIESYAPEEIVDEVIKALEGRS